MPAPKIFAPCRSAPFCDSTMMGAIIKSLSYAPPTCHASLGAHPRQWLFAIVDVTDPGDCHPRDPPKNGRPPGDFNELRNVRRCRARRGACPEPAAGGLEARPL